MNTPRPLAGIPEERVAMILARAAELDRKAASTLGLDAIRFAAIEAGISAAAVDQALAEYSAGNEPQVVPEPIAMQERSPRWRRWLGKLTSAIQFAVLGLPLGMIAGISDFMTVIAMLGFIAVGGYVALLDRPRRRASRFQLTVALMILACALGIALVEGNEDSIELMAGIGAPVFIAGTMLIKVRLRELFGVTDKPIEGM